MTIMTKVLIGGAGLAAIAAAAPATAQYGYGYSPYAYGALNTQVLAQRCSAAVQNRLHNRGSTGILGSIFGVRSAMSGRVLAVTQVNPRRETVRVRGVATSGRMAYNPYGYGYYGALGSAYAQPQADLNFRCDIDYRGFIRDIDIDRR
jgi:hypothetical protein